MDKRILFVSNSEGAMLKTMMKSLTDAAFSVVMTSPSPTDIESIKSLPENIFIYIEDDFADYGEFFKHLPAISARTQRTIFLFGTQSEISAAREVLGPLVTASFVRPVNMREVITRLKIASERGTERRRKILVVDDDSIMLRTLKTHLSEKFDIFMANSGINAISLLAEHNVDLILLDYEMPVASGLQVFEMIRNEPKTAHIPVIFLTGKDDRETVVKVLAAKPEKYLLKTMPPEELVKSIDAFFRGL